MKIVPHHNIDPEHWDELALNSSQAWIFHLYNWIKFEATTGACENLSFGLIADGRPVALMPLFWSRVGLGSFEESLLHNGIHRHTGLALDNSLSQTEIKTARSTALRQVFEQARKKDVHRIYFGIQNLTPQSRSSKRREIPSWVSDHGFQLGNSFGPGGLAPAPGLATTIVDQIVDISKPDTEIFANFKDTCRRAIRKAQKADFEVKTVTGGESNIDEYYRIAELSAKRSGETLPEIEYYQSIFDLLEPHGLCSLLFLYSQGQNVAAAILLHGKKGMYYLSGASDPQFLQYRVNEYLHWAAIQFGNARGDTHYRLGPYFPSVPKGWPIETVSRFKTKFGADPWTIVQGSLFLKPECYTDLAKSHLERLCTEMQT